MLVWEEIMQKSPTMKKIVEDKIAEEVAKKQMEIDELKTKLAQAEADNISTMMALTGVYEQLLTLQGGTV
jgi:glutamine synthetase